MHLQVLYEDNHLIAINKPAGYLVQGDQTGDATLAEYVKDYIKTKYKKPGDVFLGVIHRLDRPVSGVLLFARTSKGLTRMNEMFKNQEVEKTYWAVTANQPDPLEGELVHYLTKDPERNVAKAFEFMSSRAVGAKKAELHYQMLGRLGTHVLVEVKPKTGRPHQIRVQLAKIGCPIRGDLKYGSTITNKDGTIHLHCRSLSFMHPIKKEQVTLWATPPKGEIWSLFSDFWKKR
ncbi:MAG: RNA pseudouridine synthase [Bacteroidetes bacterium]|jgi:23S rRNA pseudouridine1911/1915/1917 synthase|nr:MAG: RNA pseudouridine synthase [Bacteroidota bacterium]PTM11259.1 MAG: RNA pseudouridine synthase [Bacteroidota bacterium]